MTAVQILSEPLTYRLGVPVSYFRDLALLEGGDNAARARLERHAEEMDAEQPRTLARMRDVADARAERLILERAERIPEVRRDAFVEHARQEREMQELALELRTDPSRLDGQGGYFSPPLWLIDRFATAPRVGRVLADKAPNFPLPTGVGQVLLPRLTTGAHTGVTSDGSPVPSRDFVDAQVASTVVTISGMSDTSLQELEQSPPGAHLDWAVFKDLTESYNAQFEAQLVNGSGSGAQLQGIIGAASNTVTYTDVSPTATALFPYLGKAIAAVGNNRNLPPECWLTRTSRWGWLTTSEDTQNRPLGITDYSPDEQGMIGFPVFWDDAIPTTLNGNQDTIIACRPSDVLTLESVPQTSVFLEVLSGTLQARMRLHRYCAAFTGRYPTGTAVLSGTGMAVQTGF